MIPISKHKIDILGRNWQVCVVPERYPMLLEGKTLVHFKNQEIYLSQKMTKQELKKRLMDAYSTAFFCELGCYGSHLYKLNEQKNKETVDALIKVLYPVSRQSVFGISNSKMKGKERL